jgi:mono/diheme cytochrome c family protein
VCHGAEATGGGSIPDLRYASEEIHQRFQAIVRGGLRTNRGMPAFADRLNEEEVRQIQAYVLDAARSAATAAEAPPSRH